MVNPVWLRATFAGVSSLTHLQNAPSLTQTLTEVVISTHLLPSLALLQSALSQHWLSAMHLSCLLQYLFPVVHPHFPVFGSQTWLIGQKVFSQGLVQAPLVQIPLGQSELVQHWDSGTHCLLQTL